MDRKDRSSSLSAGLTGVVIGLVAGATLVFLSDKGNREKVKEKVYDVEGEITDKISELKGMVEKANKKSRKKLATNLRNFAKQLE